MGLFDRFKKKKKQEEQQKQQTEAIEYWTLGLGDSNKALNGENPLPDKRKTATASSWKTIPTSGNPLPCRTERFRPCLL